MAALGARLESVEAGRCVIILPFSERISQQQGWFHGGAIGAIADSAGGYAGLTVMPAGSEVVTIEYKINFLRPARGALLRAVGEVVRRGQSICVSRAEVFCTGDDGEVLCAVSQQTLMPVIPSRRG